MTVDGFRAALEDAPPGQAITYFVGQSLLRPSPSPGKLYAPTTKARSS